MPKFKKMNFFDKKIYKKNSLLIKPLTIYDIKKNYIQSLKNKKINKYLASKEKGRLSKKYIHKYVVQNNLSSNSILFGVFLKKNHIGTCRIHFVKSELFIGILMFDQLKQRKIYGNKVLVIVSDFAFRNLNISYIQAKIYNENQNSIKAFERAGFKIKNIGNKYCCVIKKK